MRLRFPRVFGALACLLWLPYGAPGGLGTIKAPHGASLSTTDHRLIALARLWGFAKYRHPTLAYRTDIDWDSSLVEAIAAVGPATTRPADRAAIAGLLEKLDDPLTRAVSDSAPGPETGDTAQRRLHYRVTPDSIMALTTGDYYSLADPEAQATLGQAVTTLPSVRALVLDTRSAQPGDEYGRFQLATALSPILRLVSATSLIVPGERTRVFHGYEGSSPFSSGQYRSGFFTQAGARLVPARNAADISCIGVLNQYASLPATLLALQAAGRAVIVFEGDPAEASIGRFESMDLGEGLTAQVRVSDFIHPDGTSAELRPDVVASEGAIDRQSLWRAHWVPQPMPGVSSRPPQLQWWSGRIQRWRTPPASTDCSRYSASGTSSTTSIRTNICLTSHGMRCCRNSSPGLPRPTTREHTRPTAA